VNVTVVTLLDDGRVLVNLQSEKEKARRSINFIKINRSKKEEEEPASILGRLTEGNRVLRGIIKSEFSRRKEMGKNQPVSQPQKRKGHKEGIAQKEKNSNGGKLRRGETKEEKCPS